ncbi:MAG: hypothetical protein HWN67_19265 [Candidatus Helarchaeota archaeon]|nr:hypothetical protein [Candidatus Helarchaeota archaeon]
MSLTDWEKNGWLKSHKTSQQEIQNLLRIIERDLDDCQKMNVSADWRFAIAYNAALQCCTIPLFCSGYMPTRGQSIHYRVIQSLVFTLGSNFDEIVAYLNSCRVKRNISDYEAIGSISESEVKELTDVVEELHKKVKNWLKRNFPGYEL